MAFKSWHSTSRRQDTRRRNSARGPHKCNAETKKEKNIKSLSRKKFAGSSVTSVCFFFSAARHATEPMKSPERKTSRRSIQHLDHILGPGHRSSEKDYQTNSVFGEREARQCFQPLRLWVVCNGSSKRHAYFNDSGSHLPNWWLHWHPRITPIVRQPPTKLPKAPSAVRDTRTRIPHQTGKARERADVQRGSLRLYLNKRVQHVAETIMSS